MKAKKPDTRKPDIDWEAIEKDWRANIKSVLQIAKEHGISHTAINKRFKKLGVPRDLKAKIKAKADAIVSAAAVSNQVSTETSLSDAEIIDANAQMQASVVLSHRQDIRRGRLLAMSLLSEIEAQTGDIELYKQLGELLASPDDKGVDKLGELYHKVISTPGRIDSVKKLSDTLKNLIALERQSIGLSGDDMPKDESEKVTLVERVIIPATK